MTHPRTVLTSVAQARGYLKARGDARAQTLTALEIPWYMLNSYSVVVDADARLADAPAPTIKVDARPTAPTSIRCERTDTGARVPNARQAAFARLAACRADTSGDHIDCAARGRRAAEPAPTAPAGTYDPFSAYRRAFNGSQS